MKNKNQLQETIPTKPVKLELVTNPDDIIQSKSFVNRIAKILVCLGEGKNAVTEIADDCHLSMSTTHRLLNLLTEPGFTIYDPANHQYHLGPLVGQLAANPNVTHHFLLRVTRDEMKRLSDITRETLILSILHGIQSQSLTSIPSKHSLRVHETDEIGRDVHSLTPLAAGQKVLLSQLDDAGLNSILKFVKALDNPLMDIEQVKRELEQVGEQGYAITRGVKIPDVMAISAPVKNYIAPLSITVLGPESRLSRPASHFTAELLISANRLSNTIQEFFGRGLERF
jgi:IclR family KDG regulon transcriptional repressor